MLKIAITGNIASGKSAVEKILKDKGYKVLDTDIVAHKILQNSVELKESFKSYDILENGEISRQKLGKLVFSNLDLRQKLEAIVHPQVKKEINDFFIKNNAEDKVFVSVPLLFETNMQKLFDKVLLVVTDDKIRLERLIKRNGYSKEDAIKRMNCQLSQNEKIKKSDCIVNNDGTLENLKKQIDELF